MSKFSIDIGKWAAKTKGSARAVASKVVIDLGEAIVARTPVGDPLTWKHPAPAGYVGGRARGSWGYGFNSVPAPVDEVDNSGQASTDRIEQGAQNNMEPGIHFIVNTLPYIQRLEYEGWSKQAPAGMVRVTIAEYQNFIDKAVSEVAR